MYKCNQLQITLAKLFLNDTYSQLSLFLVVSVCYNLTVGCAENIQRLLRQNYLNLYS